jgi:bacterioferritin-associated ferredoxin
MAGNRIVCTTNNIEYLSLRKAQIGDARTIDELKAATGVCGECETCQNELAFVTTMVFSCVQATIAGVLTAIQNGANMVEKIGEATGAGKVCGKCKGL